LLLLKSVILLITAKCINMSKLTLRPYQQEAVDATVKYFRSHDSPAVIVLPTGAGKSLVIAELAAIANHKVLVLAHVKELVAQNQQKFQLYGLQSSIYSAGLKQKNSSAKVVFASVQSVVRNLSIFEQPFSLVIIDECHRLSDDKDSQYAKIINTLLAHNKKLKILGLTATPYRLTSGWIYQYHYHGFARSDTATPFRDCIYELPLNYMVKNKFLTPPTLYDATIEEYNFSLLAGYESGSYTQEALNKLLTKNQRVTQSIIKQVISLAVDRQGVMIFAATVKHAYEILSYLPIDNSALITGDIAHQERDKLIYAFKEKNIKFLVNVSVLTTGFDAPHVDVIALLRPTQSVSLFQQIVGRGLRLSPNKKDCLILDYTGSNFNIFHPEVGSVKTDPNSQPVQVFCPLCDFANIFWGKCDTQGEIIEHFGRRCQGLTNSEADPQQALLDPRCQFRFKFKNCPNCNAENDIAARDCRACQHALVDPDDQLKKALQLKDAKVIRCAGMSFDNHKDKLKITYHDEHGETLEEYFNIDHSSARLVFNDIFAKRLSITHPQTVANNLQQVLAIAHKYTAPDFVIARKSGHFWKVVDRIFDYQGNYRRANQL
jgi:DNA repair protein RadD